MTITLKRLEYPYKALQLPVLKKDVWGCILPVMNSPISTAQIHTNLFILLLFRRDFYQRCSVIRKQRWPSEASELHQLQTSTFISEVRPQPQNHPRNIANRIILTATFICWHFDMVSIMLKALGKKKTQTKRGRDQKEACLKSEVC